jgi:hypothetical protein
MTIEGSGSLIANSGLFEASSGGILTITPLSASIDNSGGAITANGGTVNIGTTIQGGTLSTLNGGVMQIVGTAGLDGLTDGAISLTNGSTFTAGSGTVLKIDGTVNLGTTNAATTLALGGQMELTGNTTLSGPGSLVMTSTSGNTGQIGTNNAASWVLTNQSTISGSGLIGSNASAVYPDLSLDNVGTIDANSSGNTLAIGGSGTSITNTGTFEATGGGVLSLASTAPVDNLNGNITANGSGSTVQVNNTIQGGTLNTLNGGVMETVGTSALLDGFTQGAITLSNGSTYTAGGGTLTSIIGTLNLGTARRERAIAGNGQYHLVGTRHADHDDQRDQRGANRLQWHRLHPDEPEHYSGRRAYWLERWFSLFGSVADQ